MFVDNVTLLSSTLQRMLPCYQVHCRECYLIIECLVDQVNLSLPCKVFYLIIEYFVENVTLLSSTLQSMLPYSIIEYIVEYVTLLSSVWQNISSIPMKNPARKAQQITQNRPIFTVKKLQELQTENSYPQPSPHHLLTFFLFVIMSTVQRT